MELSLSIPGLCGDVQKDVKNLNNYVFQLTEQLRYLLNNLDVTNFNDLGLMRYENGRLQIYTEKLQASVKEIELKISGAEDSLTTLIEGKAGELSTTIRTELDAAIGDVDEQVSQWQQTVEGFTATISEKLAGVDTKVSTWQQTVDGFSTTVSEKLSGVDTKVSQWQQTVNGFSTTVSQKINAVDTKVSTWQQTVDGFSTQISERFTSLEGTYVKSSTYNQTANKVETMVQQIGTDGSKLESRIIQSIEDDESLIQLIADRVDISGLTVFSSISEDANDGYTTIDGAYIACGSGYQMVEIWEGVIWVGNTEFYQDGYGITLINTHGGTFRVSVGDVTWELTEDGWDTL